MRCDDKHLYLDRRRDRLQDLTYFGLTMGGGFMGVGGVLFTPLFGKVVLMVAGVVFLLWHVHEALFHEIISNTISNVNIRFLFF